MELAFLYLGVIIAMFAYGFKQNNEYLLKNRHPHYTQIIAWANGEEIEYKNRNGEWVGTENPNWNPDVEYRVKKY